MEETSAFPKRQSNSTSIRRTVTTHHIWTGFEDEVRHFNAYYNPLCRGWGGRGGGEGEGGGEIGMRRGKFFGWIIFIKQNKNPKCLQLLSIQRIMTIYSNF